MISTFSFLLCIILISSLISIIIIFGNLPTLRNTWIYKLKVVVFKLFNKLPNYYNFVNQRYFNNNLTYYLNWLIPLFYFNVVSFCIYEFFRKTYKILPDFIKDNKFHQLYIFLTIFLTYLTFLQSAFTNPGTINTSNVIKANRFFKNNQIIFFPDRVCSSCNLGKPARSKHCSICNKCIMLFDHHCIWINNCVGYYNYKWFLGYLFSHINLLGYGGYLCFKTLQQIKPLDQSYWQLITSTNDSNKITGIFLILCVIFVIITSLFTSLHLRYLYLGITTNELDKWQEIEHLIHLGVLYEVLNCQLEQERFVEKAILDQETSYKTVFISLNTDKILFTDDDLSKYKLKNIESIENDLTNIYDTGFWNNLIERIFPVHFEGYDD